MMSTPVERLTDGDRQALLRSMLLSRALDDEAIALAAMSRLDLWLSCRGQEPIQVAAALAFEKATIVPSFREHALAFTRGICPTDVCGVWAGRNFSGWDAVKHRFFPYTLVLAAQCHHGVGYALGRRLLGDPTTVVICLGDGATSEGEASEALNLAAVEHAPVIFLVMNNGWALSKPTHEQMAASMEDRARGFGIASASVDGLDPEASLLAARRAFAHVQSGRGPYLLEAHVVRVHGHASSDDQHRYRSIEQIAAAADKDPVPAYRDRLLGECVVDAAWLDEVAGEAALLRAQMVEEFSR
ncbi:thiamine pyrophosphate-dependent enzyme [Luteococcus sediminum]|uniref:thiamine pyrophosphate-dependent dehydrogenase E1 component subunit alpha n=1 Tax=Luteococcus sp. TaxID=1969402 RepID=UPI003734F5CB